MTGQYRSGVEARQDNIDLAHQVPASVAIYSPTLVRLWSVNVLLAVRVYTYMCLRVRKRGPKNKIYFKRSKV
jgi:hypothetical protein